MSEIEINVTETLREIIQEIFRKLDVPISDKVVDEIISKIGNNISQINYDDEYHIKLKDYNGLNYFVDFSPILHMKKNGLPIDEFMIFYTEVFGDPYEYENYMTWVYLIHPKEEYVEWIMRNGVSIDDFGYEKIFDTTLSDEELTKHLFRCTASFIAESLNQSPKDELVFNILNTLVPGDIVDDKYVYSVICSQEVMYLKFDENGMNIISVIFSQKVDTSKSSYIVTGITGVAFQVGYYTLLYLVDVENNKIFYIGSSI